MDIAGYGQVMEKKRSLQCKEGREGEVEVC